MTRKQELLKQYIELSKKLGKLPSYRECHKLGITKSAIEHNYEKLSVMKEEALKVCPTLADLEMPVAIKAIDIDSYRLSLESKSVKKTNASLIQNVSMMDHLASSLQSLEPIKVNSYKPHKNLKTSRIITLFLSDLHFGADVLMEETGLNQFGRIEEARRLAAVVKQTIEYKIQHRDETDLEIVLGGDIIQGALGHDPRDGAPLAEQTCRAIDLLQQAISHLAMHYKKVTVRCTGGNHGRFTSRHKTRATKQKWDNMETVIYYSLKKILSKTKNVNFDIPKTPYLSYNIFDKKVLMTHGDTVISVGMPSNSINFKALESQINKINAALKDTEEYSLIMIGHVHSASLSFLGNGAAILTNACLIGTDDFSISIGSFETMKGQWLVESVPGIVVGDSRLIRLNSDVDKDKSLDKLIKPWSNL